MNVTGMPMIDGDHWMVPKGEKRILEEMEIRGSIKTVQTIALLRPALADSQNSMKKKNTS